MNLRVRIGIPALIALAFLAGWLGRRPPGPGAYPPSPPVHPAPATPPARLPPMGAEEPASDPTPDPPPDDGLGEYPAWNGVDLDCDDVGRPVRVTGPDRHRLDGDGNGVGCEGQ